MHTYTRACSEGLAASQMAHMDRKIILHLWGMRERRVLKRARENNLLNNRLAPSDLKCTRACSGPLTCS